jgi:plasmid stabilization system protein ParE
VKWTEEALADVGRLFRFKAMANPKKAEHVRDVLLTAADSLAALPLRGQLVDGREPLRVLRASVGAEVYRLLYEVEDEVVWIVQVRHGLED